MADIKALKSYLVSLGFVVNTAQLNQFNNALKTANQVVTSTTNSMIGAFFSFELKAVGAFVAVSSAVVLSMDKIAMADQEYRLFGQRMFMDTEHARALKIALDALGISLEQAAFDPESHRRLIELIQLQKVLGGQLGPNFEQTMERIRDVRMEFTKLGVELQYFGMNIAAKLFQAFGGDSLIDRLKEWNDYIVEHIPQWSAFIATYLVPILKDTWNIMVGLWEIFKEFALEFSNLIGIISGDSSLESTVFQFEKFATAVGKVVHWIALLIQGVNWLIKALLPFAGAITGARIGFSVAGPEGAAVGAAIGLGVDAIRHYYPQIVGGAGGSVGGTSGTMPVAGAAGGAGGSDVRALAQQVGGSLGIDPAIVYAQWAHETGSFTNRGARSLNNLAGIRLPGSTEYRSFGSLSEFGSYYTNLIKRRYPGAMGAQNIDQFATALKRGGYFEDSLSNYERGMRGKIGGYGNVHIGQINIMQPNASATDIVKEMNRQIDTQASAQMLELKPLYG